MLNNNYIIVTLIITINVLSVIIGFILGKLHGISGVNNGINKPKSFLKTSTETKEQVSIDDKIYVTDIKTDGMIKRYDDLGEVKKSNENITSSINKLKQMKS